MKPTFGSPARYLNRLSGPGPRTSGPKGPPGVRSTCSLFGGTIQPVKRSPVKRSPKLRDLNRSAANVVRDATDEREPQPESAQARGGRPAAAKGGRTKAEAAFARN